ncbi:MAG: putative glycoside hydrolase, partial [Bacillota bacterium]|nr:putative glycoside hydrolase [Bacillota bacterium]
ATARNSLGRSPSPVLLTPSQTEKGVQAYREKMRVERKGLYLSAAGASHSGIYQAAVNLAKKSEINTLVIDVKEDGRIYFPTDDPLLVSVGAIGPVIPDLKEKIVDLHEKGVYVIARVVVVKDPGLAKVHPEWAIQDARGGVWKDRTGQAWMDPYNEHVWEYNVRVALEAAKLGFDEIQFDYIRFPSDGQLSQIRYPDAQGRTRVEAIRELMEAARSALGYGNVPFSADIFGLIPSVKNDQGIGQYWEEVSLAADYLSPMVYPSHYARGTFGLSNPNEFPGPTVAHSMRDAVKRTPSWGAWVRPWLQDFSLYGVHYTPAMVREQIQASDQEGGIGWLLWNAANCYHPAALTPKEGQTLPQGDVTTCQKPVQEALSQ